jgi:hypothetical protein
MMMTDQFETPSPIFERKVGQIKFKKTENSHVPLMFEEFEPVLRYISFQKITHTHGQCPKL